MLSLWEICQPKQATTWRLSDRNIQKDAQIYHMIPSIDKELNIASALFHDLLKVGESVSSTQLSLI